MNYGSRIMGTGSGLPQKVMKNSEFEAFLDTSDEWIKKRTGIEERRIADPKLGETSFSLAARAADGALRMADLKGKDLGLIVVGTVTPDTVMPCTANQLQGILGATQAFSFDLQAACSGFLYGLSIADQYIRTGAIETALVIGVETLSTIVNWRDRSTCVLFGDGAGAVVLRRTENEHRVLSARLYSDGSMGEMLYLPHGYSKVPPWSADFRLDLNKVRMRGSEIFKFAIRNMVEAAKQILVDNGLTARDVDFFIFHQANIRIIEMCAEALEVEPSKMWNNVHKYGNISAATLPVCLDEAWRANAVRPGSLVLMVTFGGGLTWAAALVRL